MKKSNQTFRSRIFQYAWATVKSVGCSFKDALKSAWILHKQSNRLSKESIKQILKDNKNNLKGKRLIINDAEYKTLKDFGTALLNLTNYDYIECVTWLKDYGERCLSVEHSLRYSLKSNRFDTIKINVGNWKVNTPTNLDYSHVDFTKFGTTA